MLYFKGEANPIISEAEIEMLYVQANQFALVGCNIFFIGSKFIVTKKNYINNVTIHIIWLNNNIGVKIKRK